MRDRSPAQSTDCLVSRGSATFLAALEGEEAARAGEPPSVNPYDSGTPDHLQWLSGWMKAANRIMPPGSLINPVNSLEP